MTRWMYEYYVLRQKAWEPQFMDADQIQQQADPRELRDMYYGQVSWQNNNGQASNVGPVELETRARRPLA